MFTAPPTYDTVLCLAHGAGAGMQHKSMEAIAQSLSADGIASYRYNFPYMEKGGGPPDSKPVLLSAVRKAVEETAKLASDATLLAGGKSMGGRMTSMAAAESPLPGVSGIVFYGFPLHPAGRPGVERAVHLFKVSVPMLFLQGTNDALADLHLLRPIIEELGDKATLYVVKGADHSFHVPKRSGRTDAEVMEEMASIVKQWAHRLSGK